MVSKLGLEQLSPVHFRVRMANHSHSRLVGVLTGVKTEIASFIFYVDYVVLRMVGHELDYPILLGRPWLLQAWVDQSWLKRTITIGDGNELRTIQVQTRRRPAWTPVACELIVDGIDDSSDTTTGADSRRGSAQNHVCD
ncbi:uncharacterized protein LOC112340735 [Selaginella moellendorffii]|uniref:uncharacterized protein LOC112340735 n=1 Tax=Selaginella moellendorffii TaxID=88036 RepID=UPI000D1CD082|nr:uncharacterized protein LOC112340735 [Selaginella moellendorffii]|eukprot:XP_024515437.1 uncharacterized protein LOC112340735 [Selaginella moellendorffii]